MTICNEDDVAVISLTKGYFARIDASDFHLVSGFTWRAKIDRLADGDLRTVYACRDESTGGVWRTYFLHRVILEATKGCQVDHIDGDGLNNRRSNLRIVTTSQNQMNRRHGRGSSRFKGVGWNSAVGKWQAQIKLSGKSHYLGLFRCEASAAIAYAKASRALHGPYGRSS